MRISDWSSAVCSSDLRVERRSAAEGELEGDDGISMILDKPGLADAGADHPLHLDGARLDGAKQQSQKHEQREHTGRRPGRGRCGVNRVLHPAVPEGLVPAPLVHGKLSVQRVAGSTASWGP